LFFVPFYLHKASVQTYFNGACRDYKSVRICRILCFFLSLFTRKANIL